MEVCLCKHFVGNFFSFSLFFIFLVSSKQELEDVSSLYLVDVCFDVLPGSLERTVMPSLQGRQVVLAAVIVRQKGEPKVLLMECGVRTTL